MRAWQRKLILSTALACALGSAAAIAATPSTSPAPAATPLPDKMMQTAPAVPGKSAAAPAIPSIQINAPSWLLMDYASGQVLASYNEHEHLPPASLSKIMTAYVVAEAVQQKHIAWSDRVTVSPFAAHTGGSKMFLKSGEQVTVEDLTKGMVIVSGNDATVALAEFLAGSEDAFVGLMNQTAQQLGMKDTHFVNANGLSDPQQYSSAYDLAVLSRALIMNYPDEFALHSQKYFIWNGIRQHNRNRLLWTNPKVDGLKTGFTDTAKYCLVAAEKDGDMRLIAVVMGAASPAIRSQEAQKLLTYGFRFYDSKKLYSAKQTIQQLPVASGTTSQVAVGVSQDFYVTYPRSQDGGLQASLDLPSKLTAPISEGQEIGTVNVSFNGKIIATAPVVALSAVERGSFMQRTVNWFKNW